MNDTNLKTLLQSRGKYLDIAALLLRNRLFVEIDVILDILEAHIQIRTPTRNLYLTADPEFADFAKIIIPYIVIRYILAIIKSRFQILEKSVCSNTHRILQKSEFSLHAAIYIHRTQFRPRKPYFTVNIIRNKRALPF